MHVCVVLAVGRLELCRWTAACVCVMLVLDACLELEMDWFVVLDFWFL
jgi:hypothetical protein